MKLPCSVIRDLLPLYAEKLTEPETEKLVDEHLADCPACRQKLSGIEEKPAVPVDAGKPLQALRKEILKRRWYAAAIAALCVFIAVYTWSCRANEMRLVSWEEGLIEVEGVEKRPWAEIYGENANPPAAGDAAADVLILRADSRINGTYETVFRDEDGTSTLILQGWTSSFRSRGMAGDYNEMTFCPVPGRLIYDDGVQQKLLWGEPLQGGVTVLPRLALGYYVILAVLFAAVSGLLWLILRRRKKSWIVRQICFAFLSYSGAHLLIKGFRTATFFMERDFLSILLTAAALYALLTLAWQVFLRRRNENPRRIPA